MEFNITNKQLPAITFNFEEVKEQLTNKLGDYEKLVVTEETLSFCKSEQKHLAGLKKKVDTYRKDVKKELSKPITEFEDKCKEIVSLISETESKLKQGINYYDDLKREEKKAFAETEIKRLTEELELPLELQWRIEVKKEYCNLIDKKKDVTKDIENQILIVKNEHLKFIEAKKEIADYIERRNEEVNGKLDMSRYEAMIENDISIVLETVKNDFDKLVEFEKRLAEKLKEEVKEEIKEEVKEEVREEIKKEVKEENKVIETPKKEDKLFKYLIKVEGNMEQLKALKLFMENNNMTFTADILK
jgi:predicted nucleotidyltransferase